MMKGSQLCRRRLNYSRGQLDLASLSSAAASTLILRDSWHESVFFYPSPPVESLYASVSVFSPLTSQKALNQRWGHYHYHHQRTWYMNNNKKQAEADLDKSSNHFHRLNSTHLFHVGKQMSRTILKKWWFVTIVWQCVRAKRHYFFTFCPIKKIYISSSTASSIKD